MTSRRSFLAAVMGAIAAPAVERVGRNIQLSGLTELGPTIPAAPGEYMYPYMVWDSATILPGSVVNERLLPPPVPDDFMVQCIGLHFNAEARYQSVAEVIQAVHLRMKTYAGDLMETPLMFLPAQQPRPLPVPFQFKRDDDLGIYLDSGDRLVRSDGPVTVSVILHGVARIRVPGMAVGR